MGTPPAPSFLAVLIGFGCAVPAAVDAQVGVSRVVCVDESVTLWTSARASTERERVGVVAYQAPLTRLEEHAERSRVAFPRLPLRTPVFIARDAVGAYALQTARVRGASVSIRRSDLVCVRNEDAGDGRARILVQTGLGASVRFDSSEGLEADRDGRQTWVGTYPRSGLSGDEPPWEDPYADARVQRFNTPAGTPAEVFAAPDGPRILVVDAGAAVSVVLVQQEGPWSAVRIGEGPFVLGFTQAAVADIADDRERARQRALALALGSLGASPNARFSNARAGEPAVPGILRTNDTNQPLRQLRAGAPLQIVGGEVLSFDRILTVRLGPTDPSTGRVRVLAARSETMALYGTVSPADLLTTP
jgi:hypothetical protein